MSPLGKLSWRDILNGLIMAVGSAVLTFAQQMINEGGTISFVNWRLVGGVAIGAAVTYLLKNVFTNAQGQTFGIAATAPTPPAPEPDQFADIAKAQPPAQTVPAQAAHKTDEQLIADYRARLKAARETASHQGP